VRNLFAAIAALFAFLPVVGAEEAREVINRAVLAKDEAAQAAVLNELMGRADDVIQPLLDAWRKDRIFLHAAPGAAPSPVLLVGDKDAKRSQKAVILATGLPLRDASGQEVRLVADELETAAHSANLRRVMKAVLDLTDVSSPDAGRRLAAIVAIGHAQQSEKLTVLERRLKTEADPKVMKALREAVALIRLKSKEAAVKADALRELADLKSLASTDFIKAAIKEAESAKDAQLLAAGVDALKAVNTHRGFVDFGGTIFRSLSLGSILLIVALGLAITFGLMGVINMAHGEMIAIGAYTTYVVQNLFGSGLALSPFGFSFTLPGMHATGWLQESYFLFALPLSFLAAACAGVLLERSVIRFLYRRPLESLLATWGVSLLLQQLLRLTFGANNVQVGSPAYLSGNWVVGDILLGWNRVFVIGFAAVVVLGVWLVLTRTPLGLLIRSVTQNRAMASCMGVRTERVNTLTFALGSGLAGLAGAFLSQIGNVGPSLGQSYIVDSFMVVVVGGVGNLVGTVVSGIGIGSFDQFVQQYSPSVAGALANVPVVGGFLQNLAQDSAVFGKILVLCAIILFLQWRPSGLFAARSRSLD
jgi:urea transport system permease protein